MINYHFLNSKEIEFLVKLQELCDEYNVCICDCFGDENESGGSTITFLDTDNAISMPTINT